MVKLVYSSFLFPVEHVQSIQIGTSCLLKLIDIVLKILSIMINQISEYTLSIGHIYGANQLLVVFPETS